ncbi:hypothetical protein N9N67_11415, partial [Bacteriovoracaceae bacterium]|nr:hypothetical protein [Bacteriovoracaceae bacterium]
LEVLVAVMLFMVFILAFYSSQGYNINDSRILEEDLRMNELATNILNQTTLNPPNFGNSYKQTKTFEEKEFSNYSYTVEMEKLELPDLAKLIPSPEEDSSASAEDAEFAADVNALQKMVLEKVKTNVERIIWQIRITITHKVDKTNYSLSTWITNPNEKVELDLNF